MDYAKNEIKKSLSLKSVLLIILLGGLNAYIMSLYEPKYMGEYYKIILSNISLIYLIVISAGITSEEFETGVYKQVYTGRYTIKEIIIIKMLIFMSIGAFFSVIIFIFPFISDIVLYQKITASFLDYYRLFLACVLGSFAMGGFSLFLGCIFKRFDITLMLAFVLHFGVLAQIVLILTNQSEGMANKILSFMYFTIVPLAFTTGKTTLKESIILLLSGLVFMILSILYMSKRDICSRD